MTRLKSAASFVLELLLALALVIVGYVVGVQDGHRAAYETPPVVDTPAVVGPTGFGCGEPCEGGER